MPQKSEFPRRTGLGCIICREAVAYVEHTSTFGLHIHCPACTQQTARGRTEPQQITTLSSGRLMGGRRPTRKHFAWKAPIGGRASFRPGVVAAAANAEEADECLSIERRVQ